MDKRTLIAIVLIFIVFWLSTEFIWQPKESEVDLTDSSVGAIPETKPTQIDEEFVQLDSEANKLDRQFKDLDYSENIEVSKDIILENDYISLSFSNLGAVLNDAYLKEYYLANKKGIVNLIIDNESLLGLTVSLSTQSIDFSNKVFRWEHGTYNRYPTLTFFIENDKGRIVQKEYILTGDYNLLLNITINDIGIIEGYYLAFDSGIADTEESLKQKSTDYRFIAQVQGSQTSLTLRNLERLSESEEIKGNVDWAAVRSKYFIQALIPEERLQTSYIEIFEKNESPAFNLAVAHRRNSSSLNDSYQLYLGPLVYKNLEYFNLGLEESMELGWKIIRPLGRLFHWILTSINSVVPNYGVTIIFFALLLKICLYPLTHKSSKSMLKMQQMQPYMREIQRKYKSDPKKMQSELSKLYKEHGTNPMGGCLPLLLQMPVFFALFPVLRYSIDLRQATFILWIRDLSEPDPLMILPIMMGLFMFIQQKMSAPKAVDKEKMDEKQLAAVQSQKMMMYVMPIFMVFIFRGLPSGLVLYWTIFNIFSIIQQYFIKKQFAT